MEEDGSALHVIADGYQHQLLSEDATVTTDYAAQIEQASTLFAEAILTATPELSRDALDVDREVRDLLRQVGLRTMQRVLQKRADEATEQAQVASGLGVERRSEVTVVSVFGPVKIESPYLWERGRGHGIRPVATVLGLTHGRRSLATERALTDFGAEESFAQAAKRFAEHYGWEVGRTTILRLVERHAVNAEAYVNEHLAAHRSDFGVPVGVRPGTDRLLAELDGCEIRTGTLIPDAEGGTTPVRKLPRRRRCEQWRDVRVGFVRKLDDIERTYVARMDKYEPVVGQLFDAAVSRGLSSRTLTVAVADGGIGLREELAAQLPNLHFIYDRSHLKQHFYEAAEAIGLKDAARHSWVDDQVHQLDKGHSQAVLTALDDHKGRGKKRVKQLRKHLARFADAVHYDAYRDAGFPIGSGEIESAHRYIPQKRLKLPGATWRPSTINPMLALRVLRANDWWDDYWNSQRRTVAA